MKRLIAAAVLAFLVAGFCLTGARVVEKNCENVKRQLSACEEACTAGDWEKAVQLSEELAAGWPGEQRRLAVFVDHAVLEDVGALLTELPSLALAESREDYMSRCAAAGLLLGRAEAAQHISADSFL